MLELSKRLETVETSQKIDEAIKKDIAGQQREFFLRHQLESIRKELEEDGEKVEVKKLPEEALEILLEKRVELKMYFHTKKESE